MSNTRRGHPMPEARDFRFGPFRIDVYRRVLTRDDVAIGIGARAFDVLIALVARMGETVTKSDLIRQVWSGVVVEENNLQAQVSALRRILGEGWITTVPQRGYRLAPAIVARSGQDHAGPTVPPGIAVLTFSNFSGEAADDQFSCSFTDDLTTELSRSRSLRVISHAQGLTEAGEASDVRGITDRLGIRYVLAGSLRRTGQGLRVNARLTDVQVGNQLWVERYDRGLADPLAEQDEIVAAITEAVTITIAQVERQRTSGRLLDTLDAWASYQRALAQWSTDAHLHESARPYLRRAVRLDPHFAAPHAALALSYLVDTSLGKGPDATESLLAAEAEARLAIALDPDCAAAYAVLSWVHGFRDAPEAAVRAAENAVARAPRDPMGYLALGRVLTFSGRTAQARSHLEAALRLDPTGPTSIPVRMHRVIADYFDGNYQEVERSARTLIDESPRFVRSYVWLAAAVGLLGRRAEARTVLRQVRMIAPDYLAHFPGKRRPPFFHRSDDYDHLCRGLRAARYGHLKERVPS